PWLVGRIAAALAGRPLPPEPDSRESLALAREHLEALVAARGDQGLLIARKHLGWTCQGFTGAARLRQALMGAPDLERALELLRRAELEITDPGSGPAGPGCH
ncbi:tRNA-dihydrouridine synthase, partial [Synechococcus sp. BA-132 BA5]|uniref:tRNA-dihydrouridine synthase n=1 Tax=Synechococcus sp. BA-132 BA5 TaxID=3110252 RepID=UPI002B2166CB